MAPVDFVTVVIAAHTERRFDDLVRAAESVLDQSPSAVIVSVDHNPELAVRIAARLPQVTVVENTTSQGASGTRNLGARTATTPIVAFLDDDACALPGWLDKLVEPFADDSVAGTGGGVDPEWRTRRPAWFPDEFGWVVGASFLGQPLEPSTVRNVWSENMAVRREAFLAVGGFREGFGKVGNRSSPEDTDMCIRVAAEGHRWVYVPAARVRHVVPAERTTLGFFMNRCWLEGRGKAAMSGLLAEQSDLGDEREYLRRTVPRGIAAGFRRAITQREGSSAAKSMAMIAGLAAAGSGAATELTQKWISSRS